jgi:hypothetical protein
MTLAVFPCLRGYSEYPVMVACWIAAGAIIGKVLPPSSIPGVEGIRFSLKRVCCLLSNVFAYLLANKEYGARHLPGDSVLDVSEQPMFKKPFFI